MRTLSLALVVAAAAAANQTIVEIDHTQPSGDVVGLNVTFWTNPAACTPGRQLPLLVILNGAPVLAAQYGDVAAKMADQGFAVAVPEYSERSGVINDPTCEVQSPPFPAASNVNSIDAWIASAAPEFLSCTDTESIVLVGHSAGGAAVFFAASGDCAGFAGNFIPQCEGYSVMTDANGNDKVKGVLAFEGTSGDATLPEGMFAGIVSSTYGAGDCYQSAYEGIDASKKSLVCYSAMSHYSVNNWNGLDEVTGQYVAPCGGGRSGEEAFFTEEKANHDEGTTLIADAFVQMMNAFLFDDAAALEFLENGVKEAPRYELSRLDV